MLGATAMNSKSLGGEFKMSFILQQTVLEMEVETLPLPTSPQYVLYILIYTCIGYISVYIYSTLWLG